MTPLAFITFATLYVLFGSIDLYPLIREKAVGTVMPCNIFQNETLWITVDRPLMTGEGTMSIQTTEYPMKSWLRDSVHVYRNFSYNICVVPDSAAGDGVAFPIYFRFYFIPLIAASLIAQSFGPPEHITQIIALCVHVIVIEHLSPSSVSLVWLVYNCVSLFILDVVTVIGVLSFVFLGGLGLFFLTCLYGVFGSIVSYIYDVFCAGVKNIRSFSEPSPPAYSKIDPEAAIEMIPIHDEDDTCITEKKVLA